jgi:hypothetical protein
VQGQKITMSVGYGDSLDIRQCSIEERVLEFLVCMVYEAHHHFRAELFKVLHIAFDILQEGIDAGIKQFRTHAVGTKVARW